MLNKGTASLEVKNSQMNRELENFASLEPQVSEVLLYLILYLRGIKNYGLGHVEFLSRACNHSRGLSYPIKITILQFTEANRKQKIHQVCN